jgi:hypothetical protein
MEDISRQKNATGRELSGGVSKPAWNTGTLYERDDQQARGVVTCTYYAGLQNEKSHLFF